MRSVIGVFARLAVVGVTVAMVSAVTAPMSQAATVGGSVDPSCVPPALNDIVITGLTLDDGKTLIGGYFTNVAGDPNRDHLVRLNTDCSLDTTFTPPTLSAEVWSLAELPDGKIMVGGSFLNAGGNPDADRLIRLEANGTLDTSFIPAGTKPDLNSAPYVIKPLGDGSVLVGGNFSQAYGSAVNKFLVRMNSDGSLFLGWASTTNSAGVWAITELTSGNLLVGGDYGIGAGNDTLRVINPLGALQSRVDAGGAVRDFRHLTDGRVVVVGAFPSLGGDSGLKNIGMLTASGSLDTSFTPSALFAGTPDLYSVVESPGGKLLVGGDFSSINGQTAFANLAQLNADGSLDESFIPLNLNAQVRFIAQPVSGSTLIAGFFTDAGGLADLDYVARMFTPIPESTSLEAPRAPIQQYAIDEDATCEAPLPDESDFPALLSLKTEAWGKSWAWWPNEGTGGFVCTRQPYYTAGGSWAVR